MNVKLTIPDSFLQEETRNGYTVSSLMKRVWAVELDLLQELLRVCQKYNLKVFADGGTLLGAMRHGGFIPWDDDIDMAMLRPDYDKLCEVAAQEFAHPYFFQTIMTDERYTRRHAQLRNSDTACWQPKGESETFRPNGCNQGIFIDIFVLDGMPNNPRYLNRLYKKHSVAKQRLKVAQKLMKHAPDSLYRFCQEHVSYLSNRALFAKYENLMRKTSCADSYFVCELTFMNKSELQRRAIFDNVKWVDFEFIKMPVPELYDELLTNQYGDWRTPVKAPTLHGLMRYDTERSYLKLKGEGIDGGM